MATDKLLITDRKKVRGASGKSEKEILEYVGILRDWLKAQPHLPEIPSDNIIEYFLLMNKFSIERTKPKLDMYYTIRPLIPELFKNSNPSLPYMQKVINTCYAFPFPKLTKDLCRVVVIKIICAVEDYDPYAINSLLLNTYEVRLHEDVALSDIFLLDYDDCKLGHMKKYTLMHAKKAATVSEKVFSSRIKGIHFLNLPPYMDVTLNLIKAVLKPKLAQRIHVHNNMEGLLEYIPKEVLPRDYGGEELSLQELNDLWKLKLAEYKERFDKLDKLRVREELRPEALKNDEVLGFHGHFKELSID